MLTKKQYELLLFIDGRLSSTGISPSFDEMKDALNLQSKSGIHRLISALEERGYIRRLPHRARALEIIKVPNKRKEYATKEKMSDERFGKRGFSPNVIPGNFPRVTSEKGIIASENIALPLYGRIAAGTPIEALRCHSSEIQVPQTMIGKGDHYAVEVAGDSMESAGILDGDTVIIKQCDTADSGSIVVALVDEFEVTLKRIRKRGHAIALEPANPKYETRIFGPNQVKVQGKLVGLLRKY